MHFDDNDLSNIAEDSLSKPLQSLPPYFSCNNNRYLSLKPYAFSVRTKNQQAEVEGNANVASFWRAVWDVTRSSK